MANERYILVRHGPKREGHFSQCVVCDTLQTVPGVVDGSPTRVYKPVTEVLPYLDALPKKRWFNENPEPLPVVDTLTHDEAMELIRLLEKASNAMHQHGDRWQEFAETLVNRRAARQFEEAKGLAQRFIFRLTPEPNHESHAND